jgi:hypothetical protein
MQRWPERLEAFALALAAILAVRVASVWLARWTHPFDLEWMEGALLVQAWRLQHGLPLYTLPGPDYIPFVYPPGYPALVAAASQLFGLGYTVGRVLSMIGTLAATGGIVFAVRRRSDRAWPAALAGAVFLGGYPHSGYFYDLVRTDAVFTALLVWSVALCVDRVPRVRASALLLALAFVFKTNAALFGPPLLLVVGLRRGWRAAGTFAAWSALPALLLVVALQVQSGGLFLRWIVAVPASHGVVWRRVLPGTPLELGAHLGPALVVIAAWLASRMRHARWTSWEWAAAAGVGGVAVLSGAWMRGHVGGYLNVLMPVHAVLAIALGLALDGLRTPHAARLAVAALATLQIGLDLVALEPSRAVPDEDARAAGWQIVEALRAIDGPVLSPYAPWLAVQAGHAPSFHMQGLWDADRAGGPFPDAGDAVARAARAHHWSAVLASRRSAGYGLDASYPRSRLLVARFRPPSGYRVEPIRLRLPPATPSPP